MTMNADADIRADGAQFLCLSCAEVDYFRKVPSKTSSNQVKS